MKKEQRIRRPTLERTTPVRDWRSVVSIASEAPDQTGQAGHDAQNANRVMEDYLRTGEAAARGFARTVSGGGSGDGAPQIARAFTDMMALYFDWIARAAGQVGTRPAADRTVAPQQPPGATPVRTEPVRFSVAIDTPQPVTVTVNLHTSPSGSLHVDRLHARGGKARPLKVVEIERSPDSVGVVVRVSVDPNQPAGVYDGVIIDDSTSQPAGNLSISLGRTRTVNASPRDPSGRRRRTR